MGAPSASPDSSQANSSRVPSLLSRRALAKLPLFSSSTPAFRASNSRSLKPLASSSLSSQAFRASLLPNSSPFKPGRLINSPSRLARPHLCLPSRSSSSPSSTSSSSSSNSPLNYPDLMLCRPSSSSSSKMLRRPPL